MKTKYTVPLMAILAVCLFIRAQKITPSAALSLQEVDTVITYSASARAVIDQKCFGCHNPDSKNEKGKKKLQWDEVPKLSKDKQAKMMNDILDVLAEGEMPPAKFLEFKPDAKLSEAEVTTLTAWAEENAKKLMK